MAWAGGGGVRVPLRRDGRFAKRPNDGCGVGSAGQSAVGCGGGAAAPRPTPRGLRPPVHPSISLRANGLPGPAWHSRSGFMPLQESRPWEALRQAQGERNWEAPRRREVGAPPALRPSGYRLSPVRRRGGGDISEAGSANFRRARLMRGSRRGCARPVPWRIRLALGRPRCRWGGRRPFDVASSAAWVRDWAARVASMSGISRPRPSTTRTRKLK